MRALALVALAACSFPEKHAASDDVGTDAGAKDDNGGDARPTPRLDVTVDKPSISTELATTHVITVTLTASDGFTGVVTLAASLVDVNDIPLAGWTIVLDTTSFNVPPNGTAMAIATVTIPSEHKGLSGTAKFVATSGASVGTFTASSAFTVLDQITFGLALANGQCVYPPNGTVNVTIGSKLRWLNNDLTASIAIHVAANANGIAHQASPGSAPGTAYEQTLIGTPGSSFSWYCHDPGPATTGLLIQPVGPTGG